MIPECNGYVIYDTYPLIESTYREISSNLYQKIQIDLLSQYTRYISWDTVLDFFHEYHALYLRYCIRFNINYIFLTLWDTETCNLRNIGYLSEFIHLLGINTKKVPFFVVRWLKILITNQTYNTQTNFIHSTTPNSCGVVDTPSPQSP